MRVKEFIETLEKFDENAELVIKVDGSYITPQMKEDIVHYQHDYNGVSYRDIAIVLSK